MSETQNITPQVIAMLEEIAKAFDEIPEAARWFAMRERYGAALIAVATFFGGIGCAREDALFCELATAILDRNVGISRHPLLDDDAPAATRADTSKLWRSRANVAAALEALIADGFSVENAAETIATANPWISDLAGAKAGSLPRVMINWLKLFQKGRVENVVAAEIFNLTRKLIETRRGNSAELRTIFRRRINAARGIFSPHC